MLSNFSSAPVDYVKFWLHDVFSYKNILNVCLKHFILFLIVSLHYDKHATVCLGQYSNITAAKKCMLCPKGSYQDQLGQQTCLPCNAGSYCK